jgi:hypothetical protein
MPPLLASEAIVADEASICSVPGIVIDFTHRASVWRPMLLSAGSGSVRPSLEVECITEQRPPCRVGKKSAG